MGGGWRSGKFYIHIGLIFQNLLDRKNVLDCMKVEIFLRKFEDCRQRRTPTNELGEFMTKCKRYAM